MLFIMRGMPQRARSINAARKAIPGLIVVMDRTRNAMDTFCAALERAGADAAVHLEDDIELCRDFMPKITAALAGPPLHPVQFFSRSKDDATIGSRWRPGSSFLMGQCFYLPAGMSAELRAYRETWARIHEHPTGLDTMLADFLASKRLRYWNHVPSLVQHAEGKSLIDPRRSSRRQSATFEG